VLAELDARNAATLARIEQETATSDEPVVTTQGATLAGDPARLRGIPAVGRGCAGAMAGTDPVRALLAKERSRRRR
jgi:hypothetical protein